MAYLAVDKDGTEKISQGMMLRRCNYRTVCWGLGILRYSKKDRNKWGNAWSTDDKDAMPFTGVEMPVGSIEKLTGRKITWKDEPIEM